MFTEKQFLTSITGVELDHFLNRAWYRLGQLIFTCHFLFFNESLYSPIWIRLPLQNYRLRKSLRKIKRQVENNFRVEIRTGQIDPFKEQLFQKYRQHFKGNLSPTLIESLQDNGSINIYNTMNIEVFHGKKLIAFSFFDIGEKSLASIKGVYDPAYSRYSLGIYTMIREIEYGLDHNFEFYYPGYVVPGFDRFDYKLRIGTKEELEFYYLKSRSWINYSLFSNEHIPVEILTKKLTEMGWEMAANSIQCQLMYYPAYDANIFGYENDRFLESPLFLNIFINHFPSPKFIVFYDIWKEKYVFCNTITIEDLGFYFEYSMQYDSASARHFLDFISKKSKIIETDDLKEIISIAKNVDNLLKKPKIRNGFF